ncbi:MAG: phosphodiester glycosidase family protein [Verrucomicrobiales bacterium]|nr:phosphodiester glycosidase family protein [Verrucomicrobiales bacterium]
MALSIRRLLLFLSYAFVGSGASKGEEWKLLEDSRSEETPVQIRKDAVSPDGKKVSLNLVEFSSKDFTLKVVDQGDDQSNRPFSNLRDAMEKTGCVAGLNGGFYGADFKALGVVYQDGKKIAPYVNSNRNGLASGVIWSGVGGIHIVRRLDFKGGSGVEQAIQTGPMLISNSVAVKGLSDSKSRPRSFVLTDWKGTWMLGTSSFVSLAELASVLDSAAVFKDLKVNRAINLDGGRSTGFYLKQSDGKVTYRAEMSPVRNFLGITRK